MTTQQPTTGLCAACQKPFDDHVDFFTAQQKCPKVKA